MKKVASQDCDNGKCMQMCQFWNWTDWTGSCRDGLCVCDLNKSCQQMEPACQLDMDGECHHNDQCQCRAVPELCWPMECQESCKEDPRSKESLWVLRHVSSSGPNSSAGVCAFSPRESTDCHPIWPWSAKDISRPVSKEITVSTWSMIVQGTNIIINFNYWSVEKTFETGLLT